MILFYLTFLLALSNCGWIPGKKLMGLQNNGTVIITDYGSQSSQHYYVFYSATMDKAMNNSYVCMRAYTFDDKLVSEKCINQGKTIHNLTAESNGNGDLIYVAYAAKRENTVDPCSEYRQGCLDIYFIESKDSGDTWTPPLQVPRSDMYDMKNRMNPRIMSIKGKGRLFIFYSNVNPRENSEIIAFVTRPDQSLVFTQENWMPTNSGINPIPGYTRKGGVSQLYVLGYSAGRLVLSYSEDNGVSWVKVKLPTDKLIYAKNYQLTVSYDRLRVFVSAVQYSVDPLFHLYWTEPGLSDLQGTAFPIDAMPEDYFPLVIGNPHDGNSVVFSSLIESINIGNYNYNIQRKYLTDLTEPAPHKFYPGHVYLMHGSNYDAKLIYEDGNDLYSVGYYFDHNAQ